MVTSVNTYALGTVRQFVAVPLRNLIAVKVVLRPHYRRTCIALQDDQNPVGSGREYQVR